MAPQVRGDIDEPFHALLALSPGLTKALDSCGRKLAQKFLGQEDDDHNPDRVKPRNIFNLGIGTDNLLHKEGARRYTASIEIANLTNVVALYNFLSTFSGTHFLQPRTVIARVGVTF